MTSHFKTGFLALLLLSGSGAFADPSSPAEPPKPANAAPAAAPTLAPAPRILGTEELESLRTQNALQAEQVQAYEMKNKMGLIVPSMDPAGPIPLSSSAPAKSGTGRGTGAVVTMVAGQQDRGLVATIRMPDGGTIAVRSGDHVPSLGRVKSIEVNRVIVDAGKTGISIPFAAEPTSAAIQGGQSASSAMAPMSGPGTRY